MAARYVLTAVAAALLTRPAAAGFTAGFCTAQRSLLAAAPDAFVLGRERSCGIGDKWLSEHDSADILYRVHELGYGNNTSLAAWLQMAGRGNNSSSTSSSSSGPAPSLKVTSGARPRPAGWRWDWWVSNTTAAERRFQQRVSALLVRPLAKFSARLGGTVPPAALSALLRKLMKDSRPAVLAALREVTGDGGLERLLSRDGGLVRTLASAVTELVVLTSGAAQQMEWAAAPYIQKVNTSYAAGNTSSSTNTTSSSTAANASAAAINSDPSSHTSSADTPTTDSQSAEEPSPSLLSTQSELLGRALQSLSSTAPFAFSAATLLTVVPLVILSLHLLLGVPAALLLAVTLYSGILLASALAGGLEDGEEGSLEAGLLLGRAVEAVLGGFFRMKMLRTLLMFALERLTG